MRILIVAATAGEVANVDRLAARHSVDVLHTGVGMVATAAHCARRLAETPYDLALNLGVCGSFDAAIPPGTAVHVISDRIAELGAEDGDGFLAIEELGLLFPGDRAEIVNENPPASRALQALPAVRGITVNTVHGRASTIADVIARFHPQVESMEGAAFMYACALAGVAYAQVRAVSNVVEQRNRAAWRIEDAIATLAETSLAIIEQL